MCFLIHIIFVVITLINLFCYYRKVFIHMNTWIVLKDLLKHHCPTNMLFYSNLNKESITDIDYRHAKNVFSKFNNNNLGDYHDLYVQSDTLLLADVFFNFRKICFDTYELDPAHFLYAPGLAWQACLRKSNVELELISDVDILLMIEKGIPGG